MPLTNFPFGVSSFGVPVLGSGPIFTTGNVFFVSSTEPLRADVTANGTSPSVPFATYDYAIGRCTANNGDYIVLMPNHAETITGVGGITVDVAGVTTIGMGHGAQRPRFLMDGASSVTYVVSAADHVISNVVFAAGHEDIVRCFNITAAGCHLHAVEFVENVATENFLIPIEFSSASDGNADGASVVACRSLGVDASTTEFIATAADIDGFVCRDNVVIQSGSTDGPLIKGTAGSGLFNLDCRDNFLQHAMTANELLINIDTADNTGFIAHNRVRHADVSSSHDLGIDGLGCALFDNRSTSVDTLSGLELPTADADS